MKKTIAFLLILVLSLCSCTEKEIKVSDLQITALNVGKADCFVITSPEANIVVDTGEADTVGYVCDYLNKNNITQIDALIISHFDKDHVGGAAEIIESYDVKAVYTTYYESKQSDEVTAYHSALEKKELSFYYEDNVDLNTIEPSVLAVNCEDGQPIEEFKRIISSETRYSLKNRDYDGILDFMTNNKTEWAFRVFEAEKCIHYPAYIQKVVAHYEEHN